MYQLVLYLHFLALVLAFFATGLVVAGAIALRQAQVTAEASFGLRLSAVAAKLHPISTLGLLATGAYLTQSAWGWGTPWVVCGIVGLVIVAAVGGGVLGARERAMGRALHDAPSGPIDASLRERLNDPVAGVAGPAISFLVLAIMFLMVMKPGWGGCIATLAAGAIVGIGVGLAIQPARRIAPATPGS